MMYLFEKQVKWKRNWKINGNGNCMRRGCFHLLSAGTEAREKNLGISRMENLMEMTVALKIKWTMPWTRRNPGITLHRGIEKEIETATLFGTC